MSNSKDFFKDYLGDRYVLIVDPSTNFRDSIKRFLENLKVRNVRAVANAEEARRELVTLKVGFFIVEWLLPEQNGLELCRHFRQKKDHSNTPFLLVTNENLRSDVIIASEAGVDGYLLKPFSYDDFVEMMQDIITAKQNPGETNSQLINADRLRIKGDLRGAQVIYDKVLSEKPRSARAICGLGKLAEAGNDLEKALKLYEQAVQINADFIEAYNLLLDTYEKLGKRDKLLALAEKVHALSPDNPRYTLILAKTYFEASRYVDSEKFFKKTILLSPRLAEAFQGLGNVYFEKEEYDKAIKNYKKALDLQTSDLAILNALGLSYVRKGLIKEGINYYQMALKVDALDFRVLFNLAFAYEKLGDIPKAISFYERSYASNPDFEKTKRRLEVLKSSA